MWVFIIVLSVWHLFLLEVSQRHVIAGFFFAFPIQVYVLSRSVSISEEKHRESHSPYQLFCG